LAGFELVRPGSLEEVCKEISGGDEGLKLVAGGVALAILVKQRLFKPTRLVSLKSVPGPDPTGKWGLDLRGSGSAPSD
jgi:CO/xanthine dehydrogenase FAD-binding subunit